MVECGMSRSRRKHPICGITTAESEKDDKQSAHRRERRVIRTIVHVDPNVDLLPHTRELSNPWAMAKDGKMRFDQNRHKSLMRK